MLQNPYKTLGFNKNMVYEIPPGGGGGVNHIQPVAYQVTALICNFCISLHTNENHCVKYEHPK